MTSSIYSSCIFYALESRPSYLYFCSRVISLSGTLVCLILSRISIFYFFYFAVFIISSLSVSFNFLSSISYYGLLITIFSLKILRSFSEIIIASYYNPFSVFALISLNSIAEITPTSPLIGDPKVPFKKIFSFSIDFFTYLHNFVEFLICMLFLKGDHFYLY